MHVDAIASEYGWREKHILRLPLARALSYHAAILERHEIKTGVPSFADRDLLAE